MNFSQVVAEDLLQGGRNAFAVFYCATLPYKIILSWVWDKLDHETIEDFCHREDIFSKNGMKSKEKKDWLKKNAKEIKKHHLEELDVTFLHDFLPLVCHQMIAGPKNSQYKDLKEDPTTVEFSLKTVKDMRNKTFHNLKRLTDGTLINELKNSIYSCLEVAGHLYGKNNQEINDAKSLVDNKFKEIDRKSFSPNDYCRLIHDEILPKCENLIREEVENFHPLLFDCPKKDLNFLDLFQEIYLAEVGGRNNEQKIVSSHQLLKANLEKFTVISGDPGCGKTTLLRTLLIAVANKNETFCNSGYVSLPIHITCRDDRCDNLGDLLRTRFPGFFDLFDNRDILAALVKRGVIFLVDGYDEVNENSKKLVKDVISFCQNPRTYDVKCVITGRPQSINDIKRDFTRSFVNTQHFELEKLYQFEDKIRFIKGFGIATGIPTDLLLSIFEKIDSTVLSSPGLLAMFCCICFKSTKRGKSLTFNSTISVYKAIYNFYEEIIEIRLDQARSDSKESPTSEFLDIVCGYSYKLITRNKFFLSKTDYTELRRACEAENLNGIRSALSCILSPDGSTMIGQNVSYVFLHTSIQEFLAAKWILKDYDVRNHTSLLEIFNHLENIVSNEASMER